MQPPDDFTPSPPALHTRDFILVVTRSGDIESLQMHLIHKITPGPSQHSSFVYCKTDLLQTLCRMLIILEGPDDFQKRCKNLLQALQQEDPDRINRYFAPPVAI